MYHLHVDRVQFIWSNFIENFAEHGFESVYRGTHIDKQIDVIDR